MTPATFIISLWILRGVYCYPTSTTALLYQQLPSSVVMPSTRARCPRCDRRFRRLDTHLRVSASCRDVSAAPGCSAALPSSSSPAMNTVSCTGNSNSIASAELVATCCFEFHGNRNSNYSDSPVNASPALLFKLPLQLPRSSEEWEEADRLLSSVTLSVLQASMAEEKNSCLCAGIYDVLSSRFGTRAPTKPKHHPTKSSLKQHDRALKEVTRKKNEARRALRRARREGDSESAIRPLAARFLSLLRQHSQLSRKSSTKLRHKEANVVRDQCRKDFWRFAKNLLDDGCTTQTPPAFSAPSAHSYFSEVYDSTPHSFTSPSWLPPAQPPVSDCSMDMHPVSEEELAQVIKRSKPSSTPSPMDRISYLIFKRCLSLRPALLDLFNRVIMEGSVPSSWKSAVIRLIPKSSAKDDPASPGNFRPIALTSTISKLLSGILKNRWLRHMRTNDYLDPDLQKAFLPTVPGVVEHQAKLAAVIKSAHQQKRSLGIAWLDIANAYGSVHHELIQFSMAHYHAPPEFCRLLQSWYSGLSGVISTNQWQTDTVPLKTGVYQGDPLSVVIFLTVMNTLSDTLNTHRDLGFSLPQSSISINHLLYVDDACIISSSPAGCQHLLDMVQRWLEWAQLRVKVPKCRSLVLQASSGRQVIPTPSMGIGFPLLRMESSSSWACL